jgi:NAD(P)-dependent dehydrogenase (short-subunit alcohol dehydrogenase family)
MEIKNSTVIVTGAGGGVGRAIALEFGRNGAAVVCVGRRRERLDETVALIEKEGGTGAAIPADITDQQQVDRMVAGAIKRFGRIDVLFNNAGSFQTLGALWEVDPDQWWNDVTVNVRGTMLCCRAVLPHMIGRDSGLVINMSGGNQIPGGTGYSCSKVAVIRMTELLARELQRKGSNVLAVIMGPGFVRTEMTDLQIMTEEGRYWLPSSSDAIAQGKDRPPEDCARKTMELVRLARPAFNGKTFGVGTDFQEVIKEETER